MKQRGDRIVMLTAYDATMARLSIEPGSTCCSSVISPRKCDHGIGHNDPVTLDVMIHHTRRGRPRSNHALVVADMPFLTYQVSPRQAMRNATRLFQEGGRSGSEAGRWRAVADTVRKLTAAGLLSWVTSGSLLSTCIAWAECAAGPQLNLPPIN